MKNIVWLALVLFFAAGCVSTSEPAPPPPVEVVPTTEDPDAQFHGEARQNVCPAGETHIHLVSPDLDDEWVGAIRAATKTWGDILGPQHPQTVIVSNAAGRTNVHCTTSWVPWSVAGLWGYTRVGYILVNSAPTDTPLPDAELKQAIATHEIGHLLGLPHNPKFGSVMFAYITIRVGPDAVDKQLLCDFNGCN